MKRVLAAVAGGIVAASMLAGTAVAGHLSSDAGPKISWCVPVHLLAELDRDFGTSDLQLPPDTRVRAQVSGPEALELANEHGWIGSRDGRGSCINGTIIRHLG